MKLIAETAWHHQGDFSFMKTLVSEIVSSTASDVIKMHLTFDLEEYMAKDHPIFKDLQGWMFESHQWDEILTQVVSGNKELMLLFNDTRAVEYGIQYDPSLVEVHSVCLNDVNLLSCIKSNLPPGGKIVLGVGGSTLAELENAIHILNTPNIILMFGFQNYPTRYQDINFLKMQKIMSIFPEFEYGYADHTAWDEPDNILITLLGAALGMKYIEKHVTSVHGEKRADWSAAITIDMLNELKEKMELLAACKGDGLLKLNQGEKDYSVFGPMKKAGILVRDISMGEKLEMDMLTFKRTGQASDLSQVEVLESVGKEIKVGVKKGRVLMKKYLKSD